MRDDQINERRRSYNEFHISEVRINEEEKDDVGSSDMEDFMRDHDSDEQLSSMDEDELSEDLDKE